VVVVSRQVSEERQKALTAYVDRGGLLLVVPENIDAARQLSLFNDELETRLESAPAGSSPSVGAGEKYLLLGDIDFAHPLFASFASPRYSDFTKIHFWRHFAVTLKAAAKSHVIARFDNNDPALVERLVGKGRVIVLTSGWQPRDSQFALSSKFVPFVGALLDLASGGVESTANVVVGEPVTLPVSSNKTEVVVRAPGGTESKLAASATQFTAADRPGIYLAKTSPEMRFAVNLAVTESQTAPLDLEQLEQAGVRMGAEVTSAERVARVRQQRDTELEGRQKIWRWLIVAAIGTLIVESLLAGRAERQIRAAAQSST
jgi:hypothetical protein